MRFDFKYNLIQRLSREDRVLVVRLQHSHSQRLVVQRQESTAAATDVSRIGIAQDDVKRCRTRLRQGDDQQRPILCLPPDVNRTSRGSRGLVANVEGRLDLHLAGSRRGAFYALCYVRFESTTA